MELVLSIVLLAVGFILLVKGADWFVDGSSSVARLLKIPSVISLSRSTAYFPL